jgi:DNA-binding transcriptional regulator YiaG
MTNVAQVLKAEISRISRKETKHAVGNVLRTNRELKKILVGLKRRVALLEKESRRLARRQVRDLPASRPGKPEEGAGKTRLTAKGVRSLRNRLRLTRADFAKLVGTTAHSIYLWETKEGVLRLRGNTRAALLSIRGLGAREARKRLGQGAETSRKNTAVAPRKRKAG